MNERKLLEEVWALSDDLFQRKITAKHAETIPIPLRLPFIFYMGHLPAFAANKLLSISASESVPKSHWHYMFSRGVDPDVDQPDKCHDHPQAPTQWPSWDAVMVYCDAVRNAVRTQSGYLASPRRFLMVAEHEAMHIETLHYMLAQQRRSNPNCCNGHKPLDGSEIHTDGPNAAGIHDLCSSLASVQWCNVPEGTVSTGRKKLDSRDPDVETHFAWDNEYDDSVQTVNAFQVSQYAVTVGEMMTFILGGGYTKQHWTSEDWNWVSSQNMRHPASWECGGAGIDGILSAKVLTANGANWNDVRTFPVSVSLAEARAYARWRKVRLPTEAEWVRAAWDHNYFESRWTEKPPINIDVRTGGPQDTHVVTKTNPVSWCGAVGMIGNGWEWTNTVFNKFDGFEPMEDYPEYSADFFDGKHFVLRGASWVTHPRLVRRTFRNYYHVRYPYVFSKIRVVKM